MAVVPFVTSTDTVKARLFASQTSLPGALVIGVVDAVVVTVEGTVEVKEVVALEVIVVVRDVVRLVVDVADVVSLVVLVCDVVSEVVEVIEVV